MKKYSNYKSNYDKYPVVQVSETSETVSYTHLTLPTKA